MKTCFVISPIGAEGSEARKNADDLFDLIIQPALEIFDFKVIRGDKLLTVSAITDDIVTYIQNSELCIIDLTDHNPNVFYECGRRHETARPYIHIKKKGEQIPFDISGIRTIDYDLSDGRKIRESIDNLRKFISELENTGYSSQSSTFSLTNLATTLSRIEKKIDSQGVGNISFVDSKEGIKSDIAGSPYRVYLDALKDHQYDKATVALKRFMTINHDYNLHLDLCTYLTDAFEPSAVALARSILDSKFDSVKISIVSIALDSLTRFYSDSMTLEGEYENLKAYISKAISRAERDEDKGSLYNVFSTLEYYMKNDLKALEYQKKAAELYPNSPVLYNLAKIYETLDKKKELIATLDDYMYVVSNKKNELKEDELKYLEYARKKYEEAKESEKVSKVDLLIQEAFSQKSRQN